MRKVYKKRDEEGVSPVIATILMVAITVVLAAVLYVMVIGMGDVGTIDTPLGLSQTHRTNSTITITIASAPGGARYDGFTVSLMRDGVPQAVDGFAVYSPGGEELTDGDQRIQAGCSLVVTVTAGIHHGDTITVSSEEGYFGATNLNVS